MIGMSVTEKDGVYVSKPRITAARYCLAYVIEDSDTGWIFKEQRSIVLAQLTGMRTQRGHLDCLSTRVAGPQRSHDRADGCQWARQSRYVHVPNYDMGRPNCCITSSPVA